jgi:WD40 repeat protein
VREIRVCQPRKSEKLAENALRRLQFTADGARLLAWVAWAWRVETVSHWHISDVYTHHLATGQTRRLGEGLTRYEPFQGDPAVSADSRFVVFEYEDYIDERGCGAELIDLSKPDDFGASLMIGTAGTGGFAFAPDGSALFAALNTRHQNRHNDSTAEVVRLPLAGFDRPTRYRTTTNPFTGQPMQEPVYDTRWRPVMTLPGGEAATAISLSADGRLAAVGTHGGSLHVVDVKKKRVVVGNKWRGQKVRDRVAMRVGFHPGDEWVAMIANGRLFAHHLASGAGKVWQTKPALGYLHDFAYHPAGHTVAVVDAEGRARYLDPLTGAVKKEFRWKRGPLYSVAFSPDGLVCAAGAGGGRVVLWDVDE